MQRSLISSLVFRKLYIFLKINLIIDNIANVSLIRVKITYVIRERKIISCHNVQQTCFIFLTKRNVKDPTIRTVDKWIKGNRAGM